MKRSRGPDRHEIVELEGSMANLTEDEINKMIELAVKAERERCATLCEALALRWEKGAADARRDGTWSFFGRKFILRPFRSVALCLDASTHGLRMIATAIRKGWHVPENT